MAPTLLIELAMASTIDLEPELSFGLICFNHSLSHLLHT
jgi:hypothetical protein